eukprot:CAMPEP_0204331492 /NCGR_PEP_ID=MMETSP0469-20131031/15755_1 /ASSEMBLY_ACC=CAM_ASM_000384 /TAXON_ID=2969 /ORGANISM="Oxyrrhis marina" /LENGTH=37 /DNA_ID= /DNA_START= /DNA_END= /DNA_ORIENTATION=
MTITPSIVKRLPARAVATARCPRALVNPNKNIPCHWG